MTEASRKEREDALSEAYAETATRVMELKFEIEQLRTDYSLLSDDYRQLQLDNEQLTGGKAALQSEIERLRSLADDMGQTNIASQIENERLQRHAKSMVDAMRAENEYSRAENAWLWTELTSIHDDGRCPSWICQRIEAILEEMEDKLGKED